MTETRNESTQGAAECGLRERKRRETRLRIEDCATALILEHGFHQVTIDEICEKAEVSRRTFFNYFDSKDQVAAGRGVPPIPADDLEAFATTDSPNIIRDILEYIGRTVDNDPDSALRLSPDRDTSLKVRERRRQIVQGTPELSAAGMRRFDTLAGDILAAITEFLARFPEHRHLPDVTVHHEAMLLTGLIRTALATGGLLHREQPELSKWDVLTHAGRHMTALAATYSDGWD
ncbi:MULTISPECIES: TetR/AcrR family transcriptional regulator [unclassified Corynebacterium]|uniref:TetR/AcrR family transcriptional regulator n=1 Tax=unclassified Corynebacterium TaxID=2624378 RepID=UPI0030A311EB